jgi:uncharacterized membrane protein
LDLSWIAPAIASPVIYAAVSIGDKLILARTGIRLASFYFYVGFSQLGIAAIILLVNPLPTTDWDVVMRAMGGGFFWGAGLVLMFWVLRREEVSRVMPVWQSSPIFVAVLAVMFLDEQLAWQHWVAILMVVGGATAVSVRRGEMGNGFALRPTFFVLLVGAFLIGIAQLLLKTVADDLSVWHSMALRGTGLFLALALPNARPGTIRELVRFASAPRMGVALLCTETVAPFAGNFLLLTAIANGPVSLVSALLGTRPVFVLGLTLLLGFAAKGLLEDRLGGEEVAIKAASTAAVVGGVALIAFA